MSTSSISPPSALWDPSDPNARTPVMLASDLDDALHATLYDLLVDEGYHVCVPRDPAEGMALLRTGECGAILITPLPPESAVSPHSWIAALAAAQSSEPLIALRLRKHCALIGLASGMAVHENGFVAFSPLWDRLMTRWRATLNVPCDLDALIHAIATASQRLKSAA